MAAAVGEMLPLAIGIALSVTMIITTFLMLLSPNAKTRTVPLLVGCVVGVGGALALFAFLSSMLPTHDSGGSLLGRRRDQNRRRCSARRVGSETVAKAAWAGESASVAHLDGRR